MTDSEEHGNSPSSLVGAVDGRRKVGYRVANQADSSIETLCRILAGTASVGLEVQSSKDLLPIV